MTSLRLRISCISEQEYKCQYNLHTTKYSCSVPLSESENSDVKIGGNFAHAGEYDVLPIYLQGTFKKGQQLVNYVMDFVNFKLKVGIYNVDCIQLS